MTMQELRATAEGLLFEDKVVLVAGCGQELSEATARMLARQGAAGVLLGGRSVEQGQAIAAIISAAGCEAHFQPTDLAKLDDCAALIAKADQTFGRVDALIFSAGMAVPRSHPDAPLEVLDHLHAVNVRAPFALMHKSAEIMRREGIPGCMLNLLGLPGPDDLCLNAAYDAAQSALVSLTASFAAGLAEDGIRVLGLDVTAAPVDPADPRVRLQAIGRAIALLAADPAAAPSGALVAIDRLPLARA
jgi:NAD(P)-dependent dehydrogenase (short-subunit alcohol dehydrogenase family)